MRRPKADKKIVLGITGSFGSGKTTVAKIFSSFGAKVIDADRIVHKLIRPKSKIYQKIVASFGKDILEERNGINRKVLARIVFNHKRLLKKLNRIIHPEVIRILKDEIRKSTAKIIVLDAPLLIEAGLVGLVDKLIVVKINRKTQINRLARKGFSKQDVLRRIKAQLPLADKVRWADFVIDNSGRLKETKKEVEKILKEVK
ncbi:MAG: dephospho-CoA kinase [Candidatus Omnitrophica bacterium]|nr:dephospho-CoA kinase [Candidatus Omnitrophota bacterium]